VCDCIFCYGAMCVTAQFVMVTVLGELLGLLEYYRLLYEVNSCGFYMRVILVTVWGEHFGFVIWGNTSYCMA
jgi:hypothetical protein